MAPSDEQRKHWKESLEPLERWCASEPENPEVWFNHAYVLVQLERYEKAANSLSRCLQLSPDHTEAHKLLHKLPQEVSVSAAGARAGASLHSGGGGTLARLSKSGADGVLWPEGSFIAGRYEIRKAIRGGMGEVYLAFDRELGRMVAIKTPLPEILATPDGRGRFFREVEAWIELGTHPYICSAHYVQEIGGVPRLFIEFVAGGSLDEWLKSKGEQLPFSRRLDIAIQIAAAMHHTHTFRWKEEDGSEHRGLVHRDLKPANVLMTPEGTARVTDFGLVGIFPSALDDSEGSDSQAEFGEANDPLGDTLLGEAQTLDIPSAAGGSLASGSFATDSWKTMTQAGAIVGTPPYMAPELWLGNASAGHSADVYAFGCMLYEILCGQRPFVLHPRLRRAAFARKLRGWLELHTKELPPNPSGIEAAVDGELAKLMGRCLAKDRKKRLSSFEEILDGLEQAWLRLLKRPYPRERPKPSRLLADSQNNRGVSFATIGHRRRAVAAWQAALEAEPTHLEATYNRALFAWRHGAIGDAEALRRVGDLDGRGGDQPRLEHLLGQVHLLFGNLEGAVEYLEAAAAKGSSWELGRDLGVALVACSSRKKLDKGDWERVLRLLQQVVSSGAADPATLTGYTLALHRLERLPESQEFWKEARKITPDLPASLGAATRRWLPGFDRVRVLDNDGPVEELVFSGDGTAIVARTGSGTLAIWEVTTGERSGSWLLPDEARRGRSLAAIPRSRQFVLALDEGRLALWDADRREILRSLDNHPRYLTAVAVSADGNTIATGSSDRLVRIFSFADFRPIATSDRLSAFVSALEFAADGRLIAGTGDGQLHMWSVAEGFGPIFSWKAHEGEVRSLAIDRRSAYLLSGGRDGRMLRFALGSENPDLEIAAHRGTIHRIAISHDAVLAFSAGDDGTVRTWSMIEGGPVKLRRLGQPVQDLALSPTGRSLAYAQARRVTMAAIVAEQDPLPYALTVQARREGRRDDQEFSARIDTARAALENGDRETAAKAIEEARGLSGYAQHNQALNLWRRIAAGLPRTAVAAIYPGGERPLSQVTRIAAWSASGPALMEPGCGLLLLDEQLGNRGLVEAELTALALGPRHLRIGALCESELVEVDQGSARVLRRLSGVVEPADIAAEAVAGCWLALDQNGFLSPLGSADRDPWKAHKERAECLAVSADGGLAISGGWDHLVVLSEIDQGRAGWRLTGHTGAVRAVAVSADRSTAVSASDDGTLRVWDLASGKTVRRIEAHPDGISAMAMSGDGHFAATGGRDGRLAVWNLRRGSIEQELRAHTDEITALTFSPDDQLLLSLGADKVARSWRLDWRVDPTLATEERASRLLDSLAEGCRRHPATQLGDARAAAIARLVACGFSSLGRDRLGHLLDERLANLPKTWPLATAVASVELERSSSRQTRLLLTVGAGVFSVLAVLALGFLFRGPGGPPELNQDILYQLGSRSAVRQTIYRSEDAPSVLTGGIASPAEIPRGLCSVAMAERHLGIVLRTTALPDDGGAAKPQWQVDYERSLRCLRMLHTPTIIPSLLRAIGQGQAQDRGLDIFSVLVQIGPGAIEMLIDQGLEHHDPRAREMAAGALTFMGEQEAVTTLLGILEGPDSQARSETSAAIVDLVAQSDRTAEEIFATIESMTLSLDPRIRSNAYIALSLFDPGRRVGDLLDEAEKDVSPDVREAAETTRANLRDAVGKRLESLGLIN